MNKQLPLAAVLLTISIGFHPLDAATRKGDILSAKAHLEEAKDTAAALDAALALAKEAFETDRLDISYFEEVSRLTAFAAQYHVYDGQVLRDKKMLAEALKEFQKAAELDPSSMVAPQEIERTQAIMSELEKNPQLNLDNAILRPLPQKNKQDQAKFSQTAPLAELKVKLSKPLPIINVNNQISTEVFLALAKEMGIRVLFDPDIQPRPLGPNQTLDYHGLNVEQALDYTALVTKCFWKPISPDTIFVANDDALHRQSYGDQVTKAFYLTNAASSQQVNDIAQTVQRVTDIKNLFVNPDQGVIIARSDPERMALAERVLADIDKPRAEIIVDVIILSVTKSWARDLGIALGITTSNTNINFSPRVPPSVVSAAGAVTAPIIPTFPLNTLAHLSAGDFSVTLPGAALSALLGTNGAKVLDKAELRTEEGRKSTIHVGTKVPYATGAFAPGALGSGAGALVNTQFQYFDVGLNIDVTAKVHEPDEVSLHIESDQSSVSDYANLGGVQQPVISQRQRVADVRVKEGEVNFWDVVTDRQDIKITSGIPGLAQLPGIGKLFTNEHLEKNEYQVLTLLIPHIIRAPDIRPVNLMSVPSGTDQVVKLQYSSEEKTANEAAATPRVLELPKGPAPPPVTFAPAGVPFGPQPGGLSQTAMPGQPGGGQPRLIITPNKVQGSVGAPFTVDLMLTDAPDAAGGGVLVTFDSKVLKLVNATPGPTVPPGGVTPPPGAPAFDDAVMIKLGPGSGNPPGKLATLQFQGKAPGTSSVTAQPMPIADSRGTSINVQILQADVTIK